ncbi:MAG: peptidyl-prolyl cis-trans isomerase [Deltaproteobacteria bacterium]|nr:peptidyl-prolyl cis-trans isomerase [Deltaproteobacteria bacterium]
MRLLDSRDALLAALLAAAAIGGCRKAEPQPPPPPPHVAIVTGEYITVEEFKQELNEIKEAGKGFFASSETSNRIKRDLLERLIDKRLLLQKARSQRIVPDPSLLQAKIKLLEHAYGAQGLESELSQRGSSMEDYERRTRESLLIERLLRQEVVDRIAISTKAIESYYENHGDRFVRPEEVRVRQIVTRTEEEAEQLRRDLLRGASFEDLARQHSLGPEATSGGDLGYFPRGRMPPAIEEVCFKLYPGQRVSKVVTSPYGYHLFKLIDKRPARKLSLEEARAEIERELLSERTKEAERYFIRTLREDASIDRDFSTLDRIH